MDYQDVITYQEAEVKIIDVDSKDTIHDDRLRIIILALRKGPMTVRDLEDEYNRIIEQEINEKKLSKAEKADLLKKSKRKGKTLYKYLDILMKNEFVVEAGRRIRKGQTATETLFGRTAKLFVFSGGDNFPIFETDEVWDVITKIICKERGLEKLNAKCVEQKIRELHQSVQDARVDIFTKYSKELASISAKISHQSMSNIAALLEIFHVLDSAPDFEQSFTECKK